MNKTPIVRPSHEEVFLAKATITSWLSCDGETKCGCVITKNNRIVSTGYNSFPRGCDNDSLPNLRPDKYDWMVHAEKNAVANAKQDLTGCTAYINSKPCFTCLTQELWHHGIEEVVYYMGVRPKSMANEDALILKFLQNINYGMRIREVDFDFSVFVQEWHHANGKIGFA